jgi:hypothetical protein
MADEVCVRGLDLQVGDVIVHNNGRVGAVLLEERAANEWGEPRFWTDKNVIGEYRKNQVYRVIRGSKEDFEDVRKG